MQRNFVKKQTLTKVILEVYANGNEVVVSQEKRLSLICSSEEGKFILFLSQMLHEKLYPL
ncbi:MAG: hypothetical protein CSA34_04825 [Desulfobulbus propionicus]|nr:MAG: hypothetical protein CSA34_04825 [Desulfobulbus propionicus]